MRSGHGTAAALVLAAGATLVAGCGEERRVIRDNSASAKFANIFSRDGRFQVQQGGQDPRRPRTLADRRDLPPPPPGNFGNLKITTSLQTDEPAVESTTPAAPVSPGAPWGAAPNRPGM